MAVCCLNYAVSQIFYCDLQVIFMLQMISSLLEPLLGISSDKKSHDLKNHVGSRIQEQNTDPDLTIPDGIQFY